MIASSCLYAVLVSACVSIGPMGVCAGVFVYVCADMRMRTGVPLSVGVRERLSIHVIVLVGMGGWGRSCTSTSRC